MLINFRDKPFPGTSETSTSFDRLDWRAEVLLTRNREAIENKKILDLASHDGRFSWACLKLGAAHVTGVEGRRNLVQHADDNLRNMGVSKTSYRFIEGDVFEILPDFSAGEFDTILCLGFFYHTIRQVELMAALKRLAPSTLIMDTHIYTDNIESRFISWGKKIANLGFRLRGKEAVNKEFLYFYRESHLKGAATIEPYEVSGLPTKDLVELLFHIYGFEFRELPWHESGIGDWAHLEDYKRGERVSYKASITVS